MSDPRVSTRCTHEVAEMHTCSWDMVFGGDEDNTCDCCSECEFECDMEI